MALEVEIQTVEFTPDFLSSVEWRLISPAGKLPILQDGDLTMFESGAMMEYLLDRYGDGRLRPAPGTAESALYHQWSWFSEASLARPLGLNRILKTVVSGGEDLVEDAKLKIATCLDVVESNLADREFLLGENFSAADIMMGYSLELIRHFGILTGRHPQTFSYLGNLKNRDSCVRAFST